jgi:hypothetical protein
MRAPFDLLTGSPTSPQTREPKVQPFRLQAHSFEAERVHGREAVKPRWVRGQAIEKLHCISDRCRGSRTPRSRISSKHHVHFGSAKHVLEGIVLRTRE